MNLPLTLFENASKFLCNWSQSTWREVSIKKGPLAQRLFKLVETNDDFPFKNVHLGSCSFEWEDVMGYGPSF